MITSSCMVLLLNFSDSYPYSYKDVSELHDAFKALVKRECQDLAMAVIRTREECFNKFD